jgi:hypothetical protein
MLLHLPQEIKQITEQSFWPDILNMLKNHLRSLGSFNKANILLALLLMILPLLFPSRVLRDNRAQIMIAEITA